MFGHLLFVVRVLDSGKGDEQPEAGLNNARTRPNQCLVRWIGLRQYASPTRP